MMNRSSEHEVQRSRCLNCEEVLEGAYCTNCGQAAKTGRITFRDTLAQFFSSMYSLEGPFLNTIKYLTINPGKVFRDYISGKRKIYYKPVAFLFLLSAVLLIVDYLLDYDPIEEMKDLLKLDDASPKLEVVKQAVSFTQSNMNFIAIFHALSIGLIFKIFFFRRFNLAEYTAIGFFIAGYCVVFYILEIVLNKFLGMHPLIANGSMSMLVLIYIFFCTVTLFEEVNIKVLIKCAMVTFFSYALSALVAGAFTIWFSGIQMSIR